MTKRERKRKRYTERERKRKIDKERRTDFECLTTKQLCPNKLAYPNYPT